MRMHPRRHGAYNAGARLSSALVNSYYRNKRQKDRLKREQQFLDNLNKQNNDTKKSEPVNIGCFIIIFVFIAMIIVFILDWSITH